MIIKFGMDVYMEFLYMMVKFLRLKLTKMDLPNSFINEIFEDSNGKYGQEHLGTIWNDGEMVVINHYTVKMAKLKKYIMKKMVYQTSSFHLLTED